MELQGKNDAHDALNEILKRYLLERDAATPEGEGLMEMAANTVLSQPPTITPSAAKEAEMLARLQAQFPEGPKPGPTSPGMALKYGAFAIGALALVSVVILLFFNPFGNDDALSGDNGSTNITSAQPDGLAGSVQDYGDGQSVEYNDLSSLQNGAGNSESSLNPTVEIGTGNGNQGHVTRQWVNGTRTSVGSQMRPDSRTGSQFGPPVIINQPFFETSIREMDPYPLRELYAQTNTQSAFYQIDPNTDHMIVCNKGTLLHIPKNAFVDATSGESVTQTVQVELKELYNRSEFINSNISTVSSGQQLITGGTIYVDATAAGRRVKLAKDKDIYVEFAQQHNNVETQDMQLYHGTMNERGETNLVPAGHGRTYNMVPIAQENLYFDEFWCDCGADKRWNQQLLQLWHPDFKHTWIATREFRQRLQVLRDMGYYEGGLQAYLDNTHLELWKVDQMIAEKLSDDAKGRKSQDAEIEYFHQFARQLLRFTDRFDDHGLDLSKPDARRQLLYRDVSREETERLIRMAKLRQRFAETLEDRLILGFNGKSKIFEGVRKGKYQKAGTDLVAGYLIHELGWTALSKVAGSEIASGKRRDIKVRLTGNIAYENTRAFLAFSDFHSVLPGKPTTGQLHRFAKVPENMDAWIVVVGFKNAMPYLGMLRLPNDDGDRIVTVTMEQTRFDEYLTSLKQID
jgi:hypothetical protein